MSIVDENAKLWRLLGRVDLLLECKKHGPRRRGLPPLPDKSCRGRIPNHRDLWCQVCRFKADVDALMKGTPA